MTAWVDECRRIDRVERTDGKSLGILGARCKAMLAVGYDYDDLLRAIRANVENRATNPACIATWLFRMSEREDPTGAKAWARVIAQARAAGVDLSAPKLRRVA